MPGGRQRSGWPQRQHLGPWVAVALPAVLFLVLLAPAAGIEIPGVTGAHIEHVEDLPDETWGDRDVGYAVTWLGPPDRPLITYGGGYVLYEEVPGGYQIADLDEEQVAQMAAAYGPFDEPSWWTQHSAKVVLPALLAVSAVLVAWGIRRSGTPSGPGYRPIRVVDPGSGDRVELTAREDVTIAEVRHTVLDALGQEADGYRLQCHGRAIEDDRRVGELPDDHGVDLELARTIE